MTSIDRLNELELIYRNLLETIDVGFYQVTLDGYMLSHNRAHNIILGYDPSESLESIDVRQFWQNPEDRNLYLEHILKEGFTKKLSLPRSKKGWCKNCCRIKFTFNQG